MEKDKSFLGTQPVGKLLFKLSLPTVIAQIVNMLYNIVDRIYIGHMPGEEFDIEVMFPEQYHSADLAGKPAVFRIYLHKTEEKIVPELNDAFAAAVSEYSTLAEYKEYLRELEVQRREQAAKNAAMEQALQKAIANAQMEEYAATEEYEALVRDAED